MRGRRQCGWTACLDEIQKDREGRTSLLNIGIAVIQIDVVGVQLQDQ